MLILGVDTSGKSGSIALVHCVPGSSQTLDLVPLEGGTFSAQLVPQIAELLQRHRFTKQQIDGFAVVSGPGSFTGLRIGLAAIKGLAEILRKPIAPVSLLEAVALAANTEGNIIAALDAGRGEVYVGTYEAKAGRARCVSERILTLPELLTSTAGEHVVTHDQKLAEALRQARANLDVVPQPQADSAARFGYQQIQAGRTVTPEALDAGYIRRTDAEIKLSTSRG